MSSPFFLGTIRLVVGKRELVFDAEPLLRGFRPSRLRFGVGAPPVDACGVVLHKADFVSEDCGVLLPDDGLVVENREFFFPVFLPRGVLRASDVVVILNGLNESEYRKFFPWAASIAASGVPAAVFPTSFHINRRPRSWFYPESLAREASVRRGLLRNEHVTLQNAVISARLEAKPERFFLEAVETCRNLLSLASSIRSGVFSVGGEGGGLRPFREGARVHFLGYSLGGYLALMLLLREHVSELFRDTGLVMFLSGAALDPYGDETGREGVYANPKSPLILDGRASSALSRFYAQCGGFLPGLAGEWLAFQSVFLPGSGPVSGVLGSLRSRVRVLASETDVVVPARGVAEKVGWVDALIETGAHEYPFNLASVYERGMERAIAKSYAVAPGLREGFSRFIDETLSFVGGLS